jgi:OmpA-OmpF porin, OOP family
MLYFSGKPLLNRTASFDINQPTNWTQDKKANPQGPKIIMLKQTLIAFATAAAIAGCSNAPPTTTGNFRNQGYLLDTAGNNAVVKSLGYDVCVRTSDWTPARAIVECDPDLVPKPVVKAPVAPPKVVAPPPPKVVAPPPPKPVPQRFTLSADALFDFDKATLKPEGRKKLDELADALRGTQHDTIVATGHTDRAGSVSYNQRLSERRAEAVKNYLQTKGLDVGKITAVGKGKSQPTLKPTDCRGPTMTTRAAILACLQPDRRVEIEVSGSKIIDPNAPRAATPAAPETEPVTRPATKAAPKAQPAAKAKAKPKVGE